MIEASLQIHCIKIENDFLWRIILQAAQKYASTKYINIDDDLDWIDFILLPLLNGQIINYPEELTTTILVEQISQHTLEVFPECFRIRTV